MVAVALARRKRYGFAAHYHHARALVASESTVYILAKLDYRKAVVYVRRADIEIIVAAKLCRLLSKRCRLLSVNAVALAVDE